MTKHIIALASVLFAGCGIPEYHFTDLTPFDGLFEGRDSFDLDIASEAHESPAVRCTGDIAVDVEAESSPPVLGDGECDPADGSRGWSYTLQGELEADSMPGELRLTNGDVSYVVSIDGQFESETLRAWFADTCVAPDGSSVAVKGGFVATRD